MVFPNPKSPATPPPPGLPDVETPPPEKDARSTRQILLAVEGKLDALIKALGEEPEEEEPEGRTLDGAPAGKPRDQTQSLG